jgi:hypothetical protein
MKKRFVTLFPNVAATSKQELLLSDDAFAGLVGEPRAAVKTGLPLISLQQFGNYALPSGSLKHDRNVHFSRGIIADYDGQRLAPEEAVEKLNWAKIEATIKTSSRHTPETPRYHIACWYGEAHQFQADYHRKMLARLNGALGGNVINAESLAASQGFFIGTVNGGNPVEVFHSEGFPIDQLHDLDQLASYEFAGKTTKTNGATGHAKTSKGWFDEAALLEQIRTAEHFYEPTTRLCGWYATHDVPIRDARDRILAAFAAAEPPKSDPGYGKWKAKRDDVVNWLLRFYAKDAAKIDAGLAELEARGGAGTAQSNGPDPLGATESGARAKLPPLEPDPGAGGAGGGGNGGALPPPGDGGSGDGGELPPPDDKGDSEEGGEDGEGGARTALPPPDDDEDEDEDGGEDDLPPPGLDDEAIKKLRAQILAAAQAKLTRLNSQYFVINEAGKVWVAEWRSDPTFDNRVTLDRFTFADFRKLYLNRFIKAGVGKAKGTKNAPVTIASQNLAEWWLHHPARRQYLGGVVFDPTNRAPRDCLNLWRGFGVKPAPGDWSLLRNHILAVVCRNDPKRADYFLDWLARMVQHPDRPGEVAIVLRSDEEGTGKGLLGRYLVKLCGHHGMHITHAPHLTGRFNDHLGDCVFLFADEAFFAGDKAHGDILKGLVTEYMLTIEGKYRPVVQSRNRLHLLIVSNRDWVIPASITARRFTVFEVLDTHRNDHAYFRSIVEQMDSGGLAAMLYDLLHRDITQFNVREILETDELRQQKMLSLPSLDRWWLNVLVRGFLWRSHHGTPWFTQWHDFYSTTLLMGSYLQWCEENHPYDRKSLAQLGTFFAAIYQDKRPDGEHPVYEVKSIERGRTKVVPAPGGGSAIVSLPLDELAIVRKQRPPGYTVGELVEARVRFSEKRDAIDMPWGLDPDE